MQRKPSYYVKKSFATALAGATGLVLGIQIETSQLAVQRNAEPIFVMQAYASDGFVKFAPTQSLAMPDPKGADVSRECGAGVDTDCTYL